MTGAGTGGGMTKIKPPGWKRYRVQNPTWPRIQERGVVLYCQWLEPVSSGVVAGRIARKKPGKRENAFHNRRTPLPLRSRRHTGARRRHCRRLRPRNGADTPLGGKFRSDGGGPTPSPSPIESPFGNFGPALAPGEARVEC